VSAWSPGVETLNKQEERSAMRRVMMVAGVMLVSVAFGSPLAARADEGDASGHHGDMLKQFDTDGDGKLSDAEKAAAKAAWEAKRAEHEKEMLAKFDKDGDGKLSDEERAAAHEAMKAEHAKEMLAKFDKDGNGKLDAAEQAEMDKAMLAHKGKGGRHGKDAPEKCATNSAPAVTPAQ
jgi:Ca2+-binding EF-hand superfamily protein